MIFSSYKMNISGFINNHITFVITAILVLIMVCFAISLMSVYVSRNKYDDLVNQNNVLNEQVKTYSNNLAKLYEQERFIDEPDLQHVDTPNTSDINNIPEMPQEQVEEKEEPKKEEETKETK